MVTGNREVLHMDDNILESLRSFDGVWGRVTGSGSQAEKTLGLREVTDMAARLCEQYTALARRCPQFAQRLSRLAREEGALMRRLTAEGFLLTGEEHVPASACAVIHGSLAGLRGAYLASCELAEALSLNASVASGALIQTLERLSAEERCRARDVREMILRAMGAI